MENIIIIALIIILVIIGFNSSKKHFKGEGGCCGGGSTVVPKKKLSKVVARRTAIVEGMTCDNCKARVERAINAVDGLAANVNLKKKEVLVSMEKEVRDETIRAAIEKAGYKVVEIR